jgi:uncharacterized protein (UPF0332 family)
MTKKPQLLGEILEKEGIITKEQLQQALLEQKKSNKRLGRVLIDLGFVPEEIVIDHLSNQISGILLECEKRAPQLFTKPHELIRKEIPIHKRIHFRPQEPKKEIYKRLHAGREKLNKAKELFKQGIYDEVVLSAYHAMHHITRLIHDLQEHRGHFDTTRKIGIKSVYTGRSGTSQVERYSVFADNVSDEINTSTKRYAKTIIKDAEDYLKKVENFLYQKREKKTSY